MMFRLVGKELGKCYHREGVGHLEKCGVLRGMFFLFCIEICTLWGDEGELKWMNGREDQKANV